MKDVQKKPDSATWVCLALALPLFYVLSVGPMIYLSEKTGKDFEILAKVYKPLAWLYDNTPLRGPLDAYVNFWEKLSR